MQPLKRFEIGDTVIEIYGGWNEVGGNCIVVKDGDKKIVFDQGIRYTVLRQFYGGRVEPLGISELRSINAVPDPSVFEGAEALYISHTHLDHLGLLSGVPSDVEIVFPEPEVLQMTVADWYKTSTSWLSYVPPQYSSKIVSAKKLEADGRGVAAVPVHHSAYPSTAYIYFGKSVTIFYSGDLRLESPTNLFQHNLGEYLEKLGLGHVDIAIVEGTNFGFEIENFPVTVQILQDIFATTLLLYDLVAVSIDPLDLELFTFIYSYSQTFGRRVVVASKRIYWILKYLKDLIGMDISNMFVASELETPPPTPLDFASIIHDVLKNPREYILVVDLINLLEILRKLRLWTEEISIPKAVALLTDPEPRETPKEVEERVVTKWLKLLGFDVYRVRLSGHYHQHNFQDLINIVKPKKLIPIHTEAPQQMIAIFEKITNKNV